MNQLSLFDFDVPKVRDANVVPAQPADIIDNIVNFCQFGRASLQQVTDGIPYFVNEFWTAAQRRRSSPRSCCSPAPA